MLNLGGAVNNRGEFQVIRYDSVQLYLIALYSYNVNSRERDGNRLISI